MREPEATPTNRRLFQFKVRDLMILVAIVAFYLGVIKALLPRPYRVLGAIDCGTAGRARELKDRLPKLLPAAIEDPALKVLPRAPDLEQGLEVTIDTERPNLLHVERFTGDSTADLAVANAAVHVLEAQNKVLLKAATQSARYTGRPVTSFLGSATLISRSGERLRLISCFLLPLAVGLVMNLIGWYIAWRRQRRRELNDVMKAHLLTFSDEARADRDFEFNI